MSTAICSACGRDFTTVANFDAHQQWDYTKPNGSQLTCLDPGSILDKHKRPRFKIDRFGRWARARDFKRPHETPSGRVEGRP